MKTILKFIAFFIYTIAIFYVYDIRILLFIWMVQMLLARHIFYFSKRFNKSNMAFNAIYSIYSIN